MKKIWQKSLASMVSAALCLTAFVGCLTVNAATTYRGKITSKGVEVEATAKEATIDLVVLATVPAEAKGMACAGLKVTTGYGKLTNAEVTSGNAYVETKVINGETDKPTEIPDIGADGQFIVTANDTKTGVNSFNVRLTFTAGNDVTAGTTYPVNVTYLGSKDIGAGNWDEDAFTFDVSGVNGITVISTGPVVDPAFDTAFRYILNIQQTVGVNMVFTLPSAYDDFVIKINRNTFNSQYQYVAKEVEFKPADAYLVSGSSYGFLYNDIGIYELSIDATITVEGYKDGVLTGISNAINYNLADLIATTINENRAGRYESLYSEVLWLADAALTYFQGIVDADIDNLVSPARNISTTPISDYTKYNDETSYTSNGVSFYMLRLVIQSSPSLQFMMNGITDDIRADASFTSTHTSNVLGVVNIEAPLSKTSDNMMIAGQANAYLHNTIALYDTDKIMNVKVVDSTGNVLASVDTSLAMQLCATLDNGVSNANLKALYERVLIFGDTARSIFE